MPYFRFFDTGAQLCTVENQGVAPDIEGCLWIASNKGAATGAKQATEQAKHCLPIAMDGAAEFAGAQDVRYVFDLLNNRISRGEIEDIRACLTEDARVLWDAP